VLDSNNELDSKPRVSKSTGADTSDLLAMQTVGSTATGLAHTPPPATTTAEADQKGLHEYLKAASGARQSADGTADPRGAWELSWTGAGPVPVLRANAGWGLIRWKPIDGAFGMVAEPFDGSSALTNANAINGGVVVVVRGGVSVGKIVLVWRLVGTCAGACAGVRVGCHARLCARVVAYAPTFRANVTSSCHVCLCLCVPRAMALV
jgi:hypothetical protein